MPRESCGPAGVDKRFWRAVAQRKTLPLTRTSGLSWDRIVCCRKSWVHVRLATHRVHVKQALRLHLTGFGSNVRCARVK